MKARICTGVYVLVSARSAPTVGMKPEKLFPMFLKLSDRPCLVVGAGAVGESKIASLLEAGGRVRAVAPEATPQVRSWAESNAIEWCQRTFQPGDLDGMFLVVAATSSTELHERIFEEATRRGGLNTKELALIFGAEMRTIIQNIDSQNSFFRDSAGPPWC